MSPSAPSQDPEPVGLIGLGLVGSALGGRLLDGGFGLVGHDLRPESGAALAARGGRIVGNPAAVAAAATLVILSLPGDREVDSVLDTVGDHWRPGTVIIDTTTGDPANVPPRADRLRGLGAGYLDATLSGSSTQVGRGEALCMVGGDAADFGRAGRVLARISDRVLHVGPSGHGSRMKLVTNLVLGLNRAALAEGLVLAGALGLDRAAALAVLRCSMAASRIMETKGERMVRGDFAPEARLSQHLKDVRLILSEAARTGQHLPLSAAHRDLLEAAEAAGLGALDNSAILRAVESARPRAPQP